MQRARIDLNIGLKIGIKAIFGLNIGLNIRIFAIFGLKKKKRLKLT